MSKSIYPRRINCGICLVLIIVAAVMVAAAVTADTSEPTVTVEVTGYPSGAFPVTDGKYVEVDYSTLDVIRNNFRTVTFGPGTHTAQLEVTKVTIIVPEGLTITFVGPARSASRLLII